MRGGRRTVSRVVLWAALLCALPLGRVCGVETDQPQMLVEAALEVALDVHESGDTLVVLKAPDGTVYLEEADFGRLRLKLPRVTPVQHQGRRYFAPTALPGCTLELDNARQRIVISAPSWAFETTHLRSVERQHPSITPAAPGAFVNYQLSAQQIEGQTTGGAFGEVGAFAGAGVLTTTAVGRSNGTARALVRLDSTYTRDFVDRLETLNIGDAISDAGSWGNAIRYAGMRWSRNFALRPDLLTTPLLSTGGVATVPSTVDVFVNNQLVTSNPLPAGPFVIDRLPAVSGSGDVSVVVRDALGREQVMTQSFYSSSTLLAPGLTQYSVNVGSVRNDYALSSDHYNGILGEASYRRGFNDAFTLEAHGEYRQNDARAAGLNAVFGVGRIGTLNLTAAQGGDRNGSGWLDGVGLEHRGLNTSFLATTWWSTRDFAQIGQAANAAMRLRQRTLLQTGVGLSRYGSLSLAYVRQTYRESPAQQTLSLTHSLSLGRVGTINLTLTRTRTAPYTSALAQSSSSAYLTFVHALGNRQAVTSSALTGSGSGAPDNEVIVALTESPPVGPGAGYRLSASSAGNYDADWRQQFAAADLDVEVARNQGVQGQSLYLTGAMTWLDGQVNPTRSVTGSFAMVDVAGLPNVPVYVENQLTTHTDASGHALLYNLRPYEANRISIQPVELPLDTAIESSSTIMAPPYRSGVIARFPVERVRGGTFRLVGDDGRALPVGARVVFNGGTFPIVLDGVVYVTGYDHGMSAEARWEGGTCRFRVEPPPVDEPIPDMGTVRCHAQASR